MTCRGCAEPSTPSAAYCPDCRAEVVRTRQEPGHVEEAMLACGVPERYVTCRVAETFLPPVSWPPGSPGRAGVYLWGPTGFHKTRAACGLLARLLGQVALDAPAEQASWWSRCAFISAADLVEDVREAFAEESKAEQAFIDRWVQRRVLVLDDVGAENRTTWSAGALCRILEGRYLSSAPQVLVVTSNYRPDEMARLYADEGRIGRRLVDLCGEIVHVTKKLAVTTEGG